MIPALDHRHEGEPTRSEPRAPCHCCGFAAETERRTAKVQGRLRPVCDICEAALHLPDADWGTFALAWLPEIGQAQVSHLARTAFVARALADSPVPKDENKPDGVMSTTDLDDYAMRCGPDGEMPRAIFDHCIRQGVNGVSKALKERNKHLLGTLRLPSSQSVVRFLVEAPQATRDKVLPGLRVFPRRIQQDTLKAWREAGSPYAEIDGATLHAMKGYARD